MVKIAPFVLTLSFCRNSLIGRLFCVLECFMKCPHCDALEDKVLESRTMFNGEVIRRRRECLSCGYRFTSYERIDEKQFMVIKKDLRREPFDRAKLEKGITRALEKRPVSTDIIENLSNEIEGIALKKAKESKEISSTELGEIVLEKLYHIDKVAYIRFVSVYRHFENLDEFIEEVRKIKV